MNFWILTAVILLFTFQGACRGAANLTEPENPAAMAFSETKFELILPEYVFKAGNNLFNSDNLNADLTTAAAKQEFLDRLEQGDFLADLATSFKTGFAVGPFSLYLRPWFSAALQLESGIPQLIFEGYEAGKSYQINGSKAEGIVAAALDLSYGRVLWQNDARAFSSGITLHYLHGLAVGKAEVIGSNLVTDEWGQAAYTVELDSSYGAAGDEGFQGQGFLVDLGFAYQQEPWRVGLVVKNIGPALRWDGLTRETVRYSGVINGGPEGPDLPEPESTTVIEAATSLTTQIPLVIQLYSGLRLRKSLQWNFGLKQGLEDAWGVSAAPLTYTGLDWQPAPAFGVTGNLYYYRNRLGLDTELRLKAKVLVLNLAVGWSGGLSPGAADSLNFSFATGLRF